MSVATAHSALTDLHLLLSEPGAQYLDTIRRRMDQDVRTITTLRDALQRISQHEGEPLAQAVARCAIKDAEEGRKP